MKVLMVAAENGALPGGKVGGLGDVIRDVPRALAELGVRVDVVTPGYRHFSTLPRARKTGEFTVRFRDRTEKIAVYRVGGSSKGRVAYWALEHPLFACGGAGRIYCNDPADRPFFSDASKFALFSAAVAHAVVGGIFTQPDIIHLHDWHTALVAVLAAYHDQYRALSKARLVYSIHNLTFQGIRPFRGYESTLESWFPDLKYEPELINDPRYPHCFNPMRAAINLCQRIHAVSPTYAREIQLPSAPEKGFVGGEDLERDLQRAAGENRLLGILNGCDYSHPVTSTSFPKLLQVARREVLKWIEENGQANGIHTDALQKIYWWRKNAPPDFIATSVGRLTDQKVRLLEQPLAEGISTLDRALEVISSRGVLVVLGSGDPAYERFFVSVAANRHNLIFLNGFSESLSKQLYACGDLFLMPSSYEPCGISQMLAMRSGQPCLVHAVGGLADTIVDDVNGFSFLGKSLRLQSQAMIRRLQDVIDLKSNHREKWDSIRQNAFNTRFPWSEIADQYIKKLYK